MQGKPRQPRRSDSVGPWAFAGAGACALAFVVNVSAGDLSSFVIAGSNYSIDFNQEVDVPFSGFAGAWFFDTRLAHQPEAGPMIKRFESPITDTLDPILLDANQPFAIPIQETFKVYDPPILDPAGAADAIFPFEPVYGWYEEIMTPGFIWVTPDDPRYGQGPLFGKPLITRNGNPHPSYTSILPAGSLGPDDTRPHVYQPHVLAVEFARIDIGETLGINKAMLWVGTDGNSVWGDDQLDDGTPFREDTIRVWEHPTNFGEVYDVAGNYDADFVIGQGDLDLVLMNWGRDADAHGLPRGWFSSPAEGVIDQGELDAVLKNWGRQLFPIIPTPLPEPGSLAVLFGVGCLMRRCPSHG